MEITHKPCTKCKEVKALEEFPKSKRMKLGRASWCRKCKNSWDSQYQKDNPEKAKKRKRKYYDSNRDKALERSKKWDRDHPKKAQERHNKWFSKNPEKRRLYTHTRSTRVSQAPGRGVSSQAWKFVLKLYGERCLKCGSMDCITLDHVVPLSKGGWHDIINIQPLCHSCNSGKKDKVEDYRPYNPNTRSLLFSFTQ